ncbi:HTH CENPB-type domain-containing protein [Aphelenchoides besseyi]|nr:HTH CENPB-type domain-containing protein [Aphelenchoides besseyi]
MRKASYLSALKPPLTSVFRRRLPLFGLKSAQKNYWQEIEGCAVLQKESGGKKFSLEHRRSNNLAKDAVSELFLLPRIPSLCAKTTQLVSFFGPRCHQPFSSAAAITQLRCSRKRVLATKLDEFWSIAVQNLTAMSSNIAGKKRRSTNSSNNNSTSNQLQLPQLPDFTAAASNVSPLLLVAAAAAYSPSILHRQILQQQLQQAQLQQQLRDDKSRHSQSSTPKSRSTRDEDRDTESVPLLQTEVGSSTDVNRSGRNNGLWPTSPSAATAHIQPMHKIRKLKLYSVDEKIDIIDYAKVIGNRAAGREFNVAESSIREWRKNEERLRRQSESSTNGAPRLEIRRPELIDQLDDLLVDFVDSALDIDWYAIRDKARELWPEIARDADLEGSESEMQITMGWVTRFMKRNEDRVRRIAPPVIATSNAMNNNSGSISMVCKSSSFAAPTEIQTPVLSSTNSSNPSPTSSTSPSPVIVTTAVSRRKCTQPRRAVDPTLLLTPEKEKIKTPIDDVNETSEEPIEKRARLSESKNKEVKQTPPTDDTEKKENDKKSMNGNSGIQVF